MVRVRGPIELADLLAGRVWACGPTAVGEDHDQPGQITLLAGFADAGRAAAAAAALADLGAELHAVDTDSWVAEWRRGATPQHVATFVVRLPEHQPTEDRGRCELVIEPGATFGYGHASTRLALTLLSEFDLRDRSVVDVGCGSGVLAIGAAKLGAAAPVLAIDIDPEAVDIARANGVRNAVELEVVEGSIEVVSGPVDVVCANMTAATLRSVADGILEVVAPGGGVVLSGLLDHQVDQMAATFAPLQESARVAEDGWAAVRLVRTATRPGRLDRPGGS